MRNGLIILIFFILVNPMCLCAEANYPLLEKSQTPETEMAKKFFDSISPYFNFPNMGIIGEGSEGIKDSYQFFSKEYKEKVSEDEYFNSFVNLGEFRLLQLYSAAPEENTNNESGVFFELTLIEGEEEGKRSLFLGGDLPLGMSGSKKCLYGFMYLVSENGDLKINKMVFDSEFPLGGGHSVGRLDPIEMAKNAIKGKYPEEDVDSLDFTPSYIYPDNLVYVNCSDSDGVKKHIAKMVMPSQNGDDGWLCIQIMDVKSDANETNHLLLGKKFAFKKQFDQAILEYKKAIDENPNNFRAFELMGYAYYRKGDYSNAIKALEKTEALNMDYPMGYYNLALAYWANDQKDKAIIQLKKLFGIDEKYIEIINKDPQFNDFKSSKDFDALLNQN